MMVHKVSAMWWNGHDFDAISKECSTKKRVMHAVYVLLHEINPYQIVIQDLDNKEPIPNDLYGIASSLNSIEEGPAQTQLDTGDIDERR